MAYATVLALAAISEQLEYINSTLGDARDALWSIRGDGVGVDIG